MGNVSAYLPVVVGVSLVAFSALAALKTQRKSAYGDWDDFIG